MGRAVYEDESSFVASGVPAAAVICRAEHGNLHAGILYRDGDSEAILHLGWEDHLATHRGWSWQRLWAAPNVAPERLRFIRSYCRRIWNEFEENQEFPYGITFGGSHFDASGRLMLAAGSRGLTCATFILAVFRSVGIELVDEASWPVRTERDRQFMARLREFADPEHYVRLKREVDDGCKRIRPDEVLGACACELPADFEYARREADRVLEKLGSRAL